MKKIKYIFWSVTSLSIVILFYTFFSWQGNISIQKGFYNYLNNQAVAAFITCWGAFGIFYLGYEDWEDRHNRELEDKYFEEYLDNVLLFFALKQEEIAYRKELNRWYWTTWQKLKFSDKYEYNIEENDKNAQKNIRKVLKECHKQSGFLNAYERYSKSENEEKQKTRIRYAKQFLLKGYPSKKYKLIEKYLKKFSNEFKKFSKRNPLPRPEFIDTGIRYYKTNAYSCVLYRKDADKIESLLRCYEECIKNLE